METVTTRPSNWKVPFFAIWTGQLLSLVGSQAAQFALVWWLTKLTGSATVLATASMMALLPGILLGPVAGAYVDRWNRRVVMIAADALIALASLLLVYLFWADAMQVWHVYVVMAVRSIGGTFHWPAMQASTSLMVPKEQLSRVAGLNQATQGVLNIVAPPLGALLMELLPLAGVMAVDVGTAAFAILPLFFVSVPQPRRDDLSVGVVKPSIWTDVRDGFRYIVGWPGMLVLIGSAMLFKIALTPAFSLLPLLVSEHFGGDAAQLSLMDAVAGVGIVAGGVILSVWGGFRRKIYTSIMGMIIFGAGFVMMGVAPAGYFLLALVAALMLGLMLPMIDGPFMAILQAAVAPEKQGRVFTLLNSLLSLTTPLGLAIAGPVSDWLGLQIWYVAAGVLCGGVGVSFLFIPAILNLEESANGGVKAAGDEPAILVEACTAAD
jgi:DHA3 family macrolide efflux protein-like MFS transporter